MTVYIVYDRVYVRFIFQWAPRDDVHHLDFKSSRRLAKRETHLFERGGAFSHANPQSYVAFGHNSN